MSHIIGRGRYARESYPEAKFPSSAVADVSALAQILSNNKQLIGPVVAQDGRSGTVVWRDSLAYTLFPGLAPPLLPGSPTVKVTGTMTVSGTAGNSVAFSLVRDRGTPSAVLLEVQHVEIGAAAANEASATLVFMDTVDTIDWNSLVPSPLLPLSTHTYSIVAIAAAPLTGVDDALVLLEQLPDGHSVTVAAAPLAPVNLGTAADYAIFAGSGITTTGVSSVTGDLGIDPATDAAITGFALVLDGSNLFSTSSLVIGKVYGPFPPYVAPTPAKVVTAAAAMLAAYTDASTRGGATVLADTDLGAHAPLAPGVYRVGGSTNGVISTPMHFNGPGVRIIQVPGTFDVHANIVLSGGALAQNIFWAIGGQATVFPGVQMKGEMLGQTGIAFQAGSRLDGRSLAQTATTLISTTIVEV